MLHNKLRKKERKKERNKETKKQRNKETKNSKLNVQIKMIKTLGLYKWLIIRQQNQIVIIIQYIYFIKLMIYVYICIIQYLYHFESFNPKLHPES